MAQPAVYQCPHCAATIQAVPSIEPQFIACSSCGREIEIAAIEIEADHSGELDRNRIRQLAAAKRASTRAQSYCLIGAVLCGVGALQLCWMAISQIHAGGIHSAAIAEICFAILSLGLMWIFVHALP